MGLNGIAREQDTLGADLCICTFSGWTHRTASTGILSSPRDGSHTLGTDLKSVPVPLYPGFLQSHQKLDIMGTYCYEGKAVHCHQTNGQMDKTGNKGP